MAKTKTECHWCAKGYDPITTEWGTYHSIGGGTPPCTAEDKRKVIK